jgi:hypothetical protein
MLRSKGGPELSKLGLDPFRKLVHSTILWPGPDHVTRLAWSHTLSIHIPPALQQVSWSQVRAPKGTDPALSYEGYL